MTLSDWQVAEQVKCAKDPRYFAETFSWLERQADAGMGIMSGIVPFRFGTRPPTKKEIAQERCDPEAQFWFQTDVLDDLHKRNSQIVVKSRRVGLSWIVAFFIAWLINFHIGVYVIVISRRESDAKKFLKKVKFILKNLAYHDGLTLAKSTRTPWLCGEIGTDNDTMFGIVWRDDEGNVIVESAVESLTNTKDSARGDDATLMVLDELPAYATPDETWASALSVLAHGGWWIAMGTPNGIGNVFHRLVSTARLVKSGKLKRDLEYKLKEIWFCEAGITPEQVRKVTPGTPKDLVDQEWRHKFIVPGTAVFDPDHLAACYKPPGEFPEVAKYLDEYRNAVLNPPEVGKRKKYYSGADTIEGKSRRRSTEKDFNSWTSLTEDCVQACHYYDQSPISQWAGHPTSNNEFVDGKTTELHAEWPGLAYIENTGVGLTTSTNHKAPKDGISKAEAFDQTHYMKRDLVERFMVKIEAGIPVITDLFTYQCLSTFQRGNTPGTYHAAEGYLDDPVISIITASYALDEEKGSSFNFGLGKPRSHTGGKKRKISSVPFIATENGDIPDDPFLPQVSIDDIPGLELGDIYDEITR